MDVLLGLVVLSVPVVALAALAAVVDRRRSRWQAAVRRQIALTDALHARFGAVLAPVVRRRGPRWQIAMAVPFERERVVVGALATVEELFGRGGYEIVLSRQAAPAEPRLASRPARLGKESLSWT
jgi:hypothetical protein